MTRRALRPTLLTPLTLGWLALAPVPALAQQQDGGDLAAALGAARAIEAPREAPAATVAAASDDAPAPTPDALDDSLRAILGVVSRHQADRSGDADPAPDPAADPVPDAIPVITADSANLGFLSGDDAMPSVPAVPGIGGLSVVVELFTAQGCGECPPADAMVAALDDLGDVLPLSLHVDYWDYLGWTDGFARADFTARQKRYAWAAGERAVYTPQIIVDGQDTALSMRPADLMGLVDARRTRPALIAAELTPDPARPVVTLTPLSDTGGPLTVTLVHYLPWREVRPQAGGNAARRVGYRNVVAGLDRLMDWDGRAALRLRIDLAAHVAAEGLPADARHAVLIQRAGPGDPALPGPILGALRLD